MYSDSVKKEKKKIIKWTEIITPLPVHGPFRKKFDRCCWILNALPVGYIQMCSWYTVHLNDWLNFNTSWLQNDLQYKKNWGLGYHSIPFPNKKAVQITAFDKSRNGHDQGNSYTFEDMRVWPKSLCISLRIPTLTKYREKLVWYSKGRKRQKYWIE